MGHRDRLTRLHESGKKFTEFLEAFRQILRDQPEGPLYDAYNSLIVRQTDFQIALNGVAEMSVDDLLAESADARLAEYERKLVAARETLGNIVGVADRLVGTRRDLNSFHEDLEIMEDIVGKAIMHRHVWRPAEYT